MSKPIYVLGTGLSHDGSSCLLKDGEIVVAIEKERVSRIKHDGGNDTLTVQYCLDAAGITLNDISLVVQCSNFEKDEIEKHLYKGNRLFNKDCNIPFVTISHHLAHAYSAIGTSPFDECGVMVIDGCGSFYHQCDDLAGALIPAHVNSQPGLYGEKDSYYFFDGKNLNPVYKDFSIINYNQKAGQVYLPTSNHSIGGLYSMASNYCFGDFDDAGKLMGLAPYGIKDFYTEKLFILKDENIWVDEDVMHKHFTKPVDFLNHPFKENFQYFANIAKWVQDETERAILYIFKSRLALQPHKNICYAGGVALNAVANTKIIQEIGIENLYIEPAAGDNGLAIGCAFYGWMSVLQKEKVKHTESTFLGKVYSDNEILKAINKRDSKVIYTQENNVSEKVVEYLLQGKTIAWFQQGAEFGPRALGRRSILADPRNAEIQLHINSTIKFREDFRPFAPSVLLDDKDEYFELGLESPYMILIDKIKDEWKGKMPGIVHVDGTCRVQTVKDKTEPFYKLLQEWKKKTGISVLLNTSFNKKGMPIVETPAEALDFFYSCNLDVLVLNGFIVTK
ncbi:MAG: transferase [Chitinophagaceae bacterium]|nr:transferase [Chitinophagaceae bacterium]